METCFNKLLCTTILKRGTRVRIYSRIMQKESRRWRWRAAAIHSGSSAEAVTIKANAYRAEKIIMRTSTVYTGNDHFCSDFYKC